MPRSASSPPTTSRPASTVSGISYPPVESSEIPVNAGPAKPPRLPSTAISAMPAAAPAPLRNAVGSAQKTGMAPRSPVAASEMPTVSNTGDWACAVRTVPSAPSSASPAM